MKIAESGPTVIFDNDIELELHRSIFTVYDCVHSKVIAHRTQFPIALCYSLTVHKAQGMSLPNVIIDPTHIKYPGQLGVAVGRSISLDGLQVVNCELPE